MQNTPVDDPVKLHWGFRCLGFGQLVLRGGAAPKLDFTVCTLILELSGKQSIVGGFACEETWLADLGIHNRIYYDVKMCGAQAEYCTWLSLTNCDKHLNTYMYVFYFTSVCCNLLQIESVCSGWFGAQWQNCASSLVLGSGTEISVCLQIYQMQIQFQQIMSQQLAWG